MRVAPLGAYFADDYAAVVREAALSAELTHRHPDGIAGGIAVAVAAAFAWVNRGQWGDPAERWRLFHAVLDHTPTGDTRQGSSGRGGSARKPPPAPRPAGWLGNGSKVTCPDTVPFCLWVGGRHGGD